MWPTLRSDHWLRARRGVKRWRIGALVATAQLAVDPPVAERLVERLLVGQRGRLGRALLGEHELDPDTIALVLAQPRAPGGGVGEEQFTELICHPHSFASRLRSIEPRPQR